MLNNFYTGSLTIIIAVFRGFIFIEWKDFRDKELKNKNK